LSDDGRYFAVTIPLKDRRNLAVVDLETNAATSLTSFSDFDVIDVNWVGNDRLTFSLGQARSPTGPGQFEGGGLFMVSRDGKELRKLNGTVREARQLSKVYRNLAVFRTLPGNSEEVIAEGNQRDLDSNDLYRLNVRTGRMTLITEDRPAYSRDWVLDREYNPRVVISWVKDTPTFIVWYRKDTKSPWEELTRFDQTKGPTLVPLAFEDDNQTMQVAFNGGRDTMAVYRYDPNSRKLGELLAQHPRFDMGADAQGDRTLGVFTDIKTRKVIGYGVQAEKPEWVWIDPDYARIQKMIDGALPGTLNTFRRTPDGKRLVVTARADRKPTSWYMLDEEKRTLQELFVSAPWIKPEQLVEQKPFWFKTRDGLEIPGYVFLPNNRKPGEKLPTIVHIHGGPSVRADTWGSGFGAIEGQLFASRGYAVVVPNFRITPGFGGKIYYAGFGTMGRQMLEDHQDAAKWAIEQGIADPNRICMSGASYGGYATLMSLARFPETFKCGVAGLVVSDMELQLTSPSTDFARSRYAVDFWNKLVGARSPSEYPKELSPVHLADRIKQPLMIYAGADDVRTPIEQTNAIVRALRSAGNPPRHLIIKPGEGHGYGKLENNVDLYNKVFEFLDETIGAKSRR
jgi:dipeptidyl aminopeptidase/acylaminoacyl peptidase